jgi:hypothetical protein
MVAKQESDNSEDPNFISRVNRAADELQSSESSIKPMNKIFDICSTFEI